jgi:PRC-barrel domain
MNRFLTTTAVALLLGVCPALAQSPDTTDMQQQPAMNAPPQPSAMPTDPGTEPTDITPGQSSEMTTPGSSSDTMKPSEPGKATAQFLTEQKPGDWLASTLIGKPAVNAANETIGDVNDLVTDRDGKVIAALIGVGGFLGLGEKDVAVRFEDLTLTRDEDNNVKVVLDLNKDTLASAPDYKMLNEQTVVEGAAKTDSDTKTGTY